MADALMVRVGKAIAAEIAANSATFGDLSFTPVFSYANWFDKLDDMGVLHVDIVPVKHEKSELVSRSKTCYTMSLDIAVRMRPSIDQSTGKASEATLNRLVLLIEQLHEFFIARRLTDVPEAAWSDTKIQVTSSRRSLRDDTMFLGIIRVFYQITKAIA